MRLNAPLEYEQIEYADAGGLKVLLVSIEGSVPHCHTEYELLFVLAGSLGIAQGGARRTLTAGALLLVHSGAIHAYEKTAEENRCMIVQFRPEMLEAELPGAREKPPSLSLDAQRGVPPGADFAQLRALLARAGTAIHRGEPGGRFLALGALFEILSELVQRGGASEGGGHRPGERTLFETICDFIRVNCLSGFSVEALCEHACMSRSSLYRFLRGSASTTVKSLTDSFRVEHARLLLRSTAKQVAVIAALSGFDSEASFFRVFRAATGMTPSAYRDAYARRRGVGGGIQGYGMVNEDEILASLGRYAGGEANRDGERGARMAVRVNYIHNPNGPTLGYCEDSGVGILERDGLHFKDHAKTGELLPYEDWRLAPEERARDLAARLNADQLAGMMLHTGGFLIRDRTKTTEDMIKNDFLHNLVVMGQSPDDLDAYVEARNAAQALAEGAQFGIPCALTNEGINECDETNLSQSMNMHRSGRYSKWPVPLGVAATFDPAQALEWGRAAAKEYRATGITIALEPQIDMASEPRWSRFWQTYGESSDLTTDMARAFIDGLQTSEGDAEIAGGWGRESVCATPKHFPGGGTGESGRDAHYHFGKYGVYPGGNFEEHLKPFAEGALKLHGPTKSAALVMPYYTISYDQDTVNHENVGNGFSAFMLKDLLRGRLGFTGGVFSDFGITPKEVKGSFLSGHCWGVEEYSNEARRFKGMMAGMSVYGADSDAAAMREAVEIGIQRFGEEKMLSHMRSLVYFTLLNSFRQGMFENPYLDAEESAKALPCQESVRFGYEAQLKSAILLKNAGNALPVRGRKRVYIPMRYRPARQGGLDLKFALGGAAQGETTALPVDAAVVQEYYDLAETPDDADFALVFIETPDTGAGWSAADVAAGGNGYLPISLQYRPYTAEHARAVSIAGGDMLEDFTNRTYLGKSVTAHNESDLDAVLDARRAMGEKPVIAVLLMTRPTIVGEFEPSADAILAHSGIQTRAILDLISGKAEPSGLLPMQMPRDMKTVEGQLEDVPFDMDCHADAQGNPYDFGFGMNWSGTIRDHRTEKYARRPKC